MENIETWLKSSIVGIVLLGVMGSAIAAFVISLIKPLWRRVLSRAVKAHLVPVVRLNYELGYMESGKKSMLIVLLGHKIFTFLIYFWISLSSIIILTARLVSETQLDFFVFDVLLSSLVFFSLYQMIYTWWCFKSTYHAHISAATKDSAKKAEEDVLSKF